MTQNLLEKIYDHSNNGLDIIFDVCPQAVDAVANKRKFRLRSSEHTPSACVYPPKDANDCWHVKDFGMGEGEGYFSPIDLYMWDRGYTQAQFAIAVQKLAEQYGVQDELKQGANKPEVIKRPALPCEIGKPVRVTYGDGFTAADLSVWGPCVKAEHLMELDWNTVATITRTSDGTTTIKKPTDTYPIYAQVCMYQDDDGNMQSFIKVYEPKNFNKSFRFSIIGHKPQHYLFGLAALRRKYEERGEVKLDEVVIVSGGSDAANCLSMGYQPVWLSSETETLQEADLKLLMKYAKRVVNIPDIDDTGMKAGRRLALSLPTIHTAWMTASDMHLLHDNRGRYRKDLKDYIQLNPHRAAMRRLISRAQCAQYWIERHDKDGNISYSISAARLNYYLALNGYYTLKDDAHKDPVYIHIDGIKVTRVMAKTITNFLFTQAQREGLDEALQNRLLRSHDLPTNSVSHLIECDNLDFNNSTPTSQRFYFRNGWVEVTGSDITRHPYSNLCDSYVWADNIVEHDYRNMPAMFTVDKNSEGQLVVAITENQPSKLFQFVINASRLYWRKVDEGHQSLTLQERNDENQCLLAKLVNIGYLLHGYKSESAAWATFCMDSTMGETEDECNGRSGKSFYLKALGQLLNTFSIEARVKSVVENRFLFDGVSEKTDLIIVDECHKALNFDYFFGRITGTFRGEAKGDHPFEIPFSKSPKFAFGTNYTIRKNDPSTMGRVWPQIFSDYYHEKTKQNDYLQTRKISDDFGCNLMGSEYPENDWQADIAFLMQCVKLYLSLPAAERKIMPPMQQVERRAERAAVGKDFEEWAEVYFAPDGGNLDREIKQDEMYANFSREITYRVSKNVFTKRLKAYCDYASHIHCLNPASITGKPKDGERILRRADGVLSYFYYVQSTEEYEAKLAERAQRGSESEEQVIIF